MSMTKLVWARSIGVLSIAKMGPRKSRSFLSMTKLVWARFMGRGLVLWSLHPIFVVLKLMCERHLST